MSPMFEEENMMPLGDEHLGFKKLEGELSHEKGIHDPAALAAKIGMEKMGKKAFEARAHGKDEDQEMDGTIQPDPAIGVGVENVVENRGYDGSYKNLEMTYHPTGDLDLPFEVRPVESVMQVEVGFNDPGAGSEQMPQHQSSMADIGGMPPFGTQPMGVEFADSQLAAMNDTPVPAGQLNWGSGDYVFLPEQPNSMVREVTAMDRWED